MKYERLTKIESDKEWVLDCEKCEHKRECTLSGAMDKNYQYCLERIGKRLAELEDKIEHGTLKEEKTCTNISDMHPVDGFTCSECGISLEDYPEKEVDEESGDITYREYAFNYCPNCGAKVQY